jgi:hypothetical protein
MDIQESIAILLLPLCDFMAGHRVGITFYVIYYYTYNLCICLYIMYNNNNNTNDENNRNIYLKIHFIMPV